MNARVFAFALGAVLLAIVAASAGWVTHRLVAGDAPPAMSAETGKPAPDFSLADEAGNTHRLRDYRGQIVLVNFWATWCSPCVREMPMLVKVQNRFADRGLQVLGLTMDRREPAQAFASEIGINYPLLGDNRSVAVVQDAFGENRLPFSVLIGRQGRLRWQHAGELEEAELVSQIEAALQ